MYVPHILHNNLRLYDQMYKTAIFILCSTRLLCKIKLSIKNYNVHLCMNTLQISYFFILPKISTFLNSMKADSMFVTTSFICYFEFRCITMNR